MIGKHCQKMEKSYAIDSLFASLNLNVRKISSVRKSLSLEEDNKAKNNLDLRLIRLRPLPHI